MLPNNNILVGNQEFLVFLCANAHKRNSTIFVLDMLICFELSQMFYHQGNLLLITLKILTAKKKQVVCFGLVEFETRLTSNRDRNIFYDERLTIHSILFFVPFLKDKAPDVQPTVEEDISQEDWLSIKASLAQANDREELERIKEDRVEYQEVQYSDSNLTTAMYVQRSYMYM